MNSPCYECPERGCGPKHDTCQAYLEFKRIMDSKSKDNQHRYIISASGRKWMRKIYEKEQK